MTSYRITCTTKSRCPHGRHIVAVGLENLETITVPDEAYRMMDQGDQFYTLADTELAYVEKDTCGCRVRTLRSRADTTPLNNLDSLLAC